MQNDFGIRDVGTSESFYSEKQLPQRQFVGNKNAQNRPGLPLFKRANRLRNSVLLHPCRGR